MSLADHTVLYGVQYSVQYIHQYGISTRTILRTVQYSTEYSSVHTIPWYLTTMTSNLQSNIGSLKRVTSKPFNIKEKSHVERLHN
jgi:hypothetical protein